MIKFLIRSAAFFILMVASISALAQSAEQLLDKAGELCNLSKYEEALKYCDEAIKKDPQNAKTYNLKGIIYYNLKLYDRAIENYSEAIKLGPENKRFYAGRADCYLEKGDYSAAAIQFQAALKIDPKCGVSKYGLGKLAYNAKNYEQALQFFTDALNFGGVSPKLCNWYLGLVYEAKGEYGLAINSYTQIVKENINDADGYKLRARVYHYFLKDYEKAFDDYQTILRISPNEQGVKDALALLPKKKTQPDLIDQNPPQISITSPSIKRGLKVTESNKRINITGKATDESGIYEVMVNGIEAKVDASGNFSASVPLAIGENNFTVTATDVKMNKGDYSFTVNRTAVENIETPIIPVSNTEMGQEGKYYALIIGIEDYQDPSIPDLEEPVADASSLNNVLNTKYTFEKENIRLLKNPTRYQVFQALEALSQKVKESDNLLIFYAGHGYWDEQRKQGYWFPSDGKKTDRSSWITNADLKEYVSAIPSKHTLLITDACFAGSIFKSRSIVSNASMAVKQLYELPSRKAMTSGSLKEVPDKSVFIEYLVKRLNQNSEKFLSAEQLFSSFRTAVINNSANGQVPQYGEIKEAGDEGGDFIFIKR